MFKEEDNKEKLNEMREREAEDLSQILAQKYKLPYLDLSRVTIDLDALKIIPEETAIAAKIAVFQKVGKKIQVAAQSPNPEPTKLALKELEQKGYQPTVYMVSEISLKRAWKRYAEVPDFVEISKGIIEISSEKLEDLLKQSKTIDDLKNIFSAAVLSKKDRRISEVLEIVLAGAISSNASDAHIEPQEKQVKLRFRLDGVLHDIFFFENKIYNLLLSRIKLVSGLKLNIRDRAQDGRFSIHLKDSEIEVRVSVIPGNYGESIVLRILNPKTISVAFEDLGIEKRLLEIISKELKKPNGMILTTGPTGSGKTTTLYAFLKKIYTTEIKIITLEDPIEYHLTGINQTQIEEEKDYTFSNGLRSVLRQDPDVIMVGEIRDLDTAKIAINAALTGHMVLSTLHTNNAAGTIPRLIDLGVNPNIIAPAVNMAIAQRLVRKLCDKCKQKREPKKEELEIVKKIIKTLPQNYDTPAELAFWEAKGCDSCNNMGYRGRIGIFEAILVDENIEKLILKKPGETEILKAAESQNILDMKQDGVLKAIKGITTIEELQRVVEL
ncbi:GspE/PulE family protein [Patescibacteria group bacterium]|nr:GspE/PulE family protein [Patescibacteria group bacterium]MBU4353082.1 GspE/PulE family protein [Patescibacteria group bacterium]MBU4477187.1 GspE/PulE family protein [Patescibacteria group bacterium]MCG2699108.1 GspE/PulE family protein [Candidatus Parcubacteria bacterium]